MTQRAVNNAIVLYELGITSEELQTARGITEKVPALLNVLRSPLVTSEKKHHLIERVFDGSGLPRHLINFYKVMCNDGGIEELADIYAEWQKIWDTAHNRVQVECVFAETPSPEKENESFPLTEVSRQRTDLSDQHKSFSPGWCAHPYRQRRIRLDICSTYPSAEGCRRTDLKL